MMEIKKDSWHYFIWSVSYKLFYRDTPKQTNLCRYFWRMVLFAVFLLPVYTIRKLLSIERGKITTTDIFYDKPITYYGDYYVKNSIQFIITISLLWAIFLSIPFVFPFVLLVKIYITFFLCVFVCFVWGGMAIGCYLLVKHYGGKTNIVIEYTKAKKNKICPIISFKEKE